MSQQVSALRIGLMVLGVLALIPATIGFGLYGFVAVLVMIVLTAFAR